MRTVLADVSTDMRQRVEVSVVAASARGGSSRPAVAELDARVQFPTSLLPGGHRQIRVLVLDGPGSRERDSSAGGVQILAIDLEVRQPASMHGTVSVTPSELTVDRAALAWTRIDLALAENVACGTDLGELRVRVRDVARGGATAEVVAALPPVDCRGPHPQIG